MTATFVSGAPGLVSIWTGDKDLTVVEVPPDWRLSLVPQHFTVWSDKRAHTWLKPMTTEVAVLMPDTAPEVI